MLNKNIVILSFAQVFSFISGPITVFLSGIIASKMIEAQSFATLPSALMIGGTAVGSIIASYTMSIIGRKFGFILAALLTSFSALIASYSVFNNIFLIYCFSNFFIGIGYAFTAQYRFAAAESVSEKNIPNAISVILLSSMVGALIGPNIATYTKDFIPDGMYSGSYIFLSILTFVPIFFFIFFTENKIKNNIENFSIAKRSYVQLLIQPKFYQAVIGSGIGYCVMAFLMTATPISMHIHNEISIGKTGFVIMFHVIAMFLPSLITGKLIKIYGHSQIMYCGVFVLMISILLNFINQSFYNYLLGLIFLGIGWNFLFVSGTSLLILSYNSQEKFRAQGLNDFIIFSTQAIGALSAGLLLSIFGWKLINIFCIPLLFIIVLTIIVSEYQQKVIKNL